MHILIVPTMYPNTYNPVSNIFFRDQAEALSKHGHKVGVLAIVPITMQSIIKHKKMDFGLRVFEYKRVSTYLFQFPVPPKSQWLQQFLRKILSLILFKKYVRSHSKPDIMHVHTYKAAITAISINKHYNIPYVITEHSSEFYNSHISRIVFKSAHEAFSKSIANIAVSESYATLLKDKFNTNFRYLPNIVDTDFFSPESLPNNTINESDTIWLLNIANLKKIKNHETLIHAFQKLCVEIKDVKIGLRIGGQGIELNNLQNLVKRLNLNDKVFFLGALSRDVVRDEMRKCNIFILSSHYETFSVVLIEAMSCGKPVISTNCYGPESIITDRSHGLIVNNTVHDLSDGLKNMISNLNAYNKNDIRSYVAKTFSATIIAKKLTEIYESATYKDRNI